MALAWFLQKKLYQKNWQKNLKIQVSFQDSAIYEGEESTLKEVVVNDKLLPIPALELGISMSRNLEFDREAKANASITDQSYNVYLNGDKCSYHNVWDDQIISRSHRWGYLEYAHQLDRCTKQQIKTITAGTLRDWFHENARDSRHIYELVGPNEKLDKNETKSFVNHTHEYAERQILRAGYRLAHVLNELFD